MGAIMRDIKDYPLLTSPLAHRLRHCANVSEAALSSLGELGQTRGCAQRGEAIRAADQVLVVERGWAFRFQLLDDGGRQITDLIAPGDIINCEAMPGLAPAHPIEALTPVTIRVFEADSFLQTLIRRPALGAAIWWSELQTANMLREQIIRLGRRDARARLSHVFMELLIRARCAGVAQNDTIQIPLSQSHLADLAGLTAVHVSRTLSNLNGLVAWSRKSIQIIDEDELARIAGFDPAYLNLRAHVRRRAGGAFAAAR